MQKRSWRITMVSWNMSSQEQSTSPRPPSHALCPPHFYASSSNLNQISSLYSHCSCSKNTLPLSSRLGNSLALRLRRVGGVKEEHSRSICSLSLTLLPGKSLLHVCWRVSPRGLPATRWHWAHHRCRLYTELSGKWGEMIVKEASGTVASVRFSLNRKRVGQSQALTSGNRQAQEQILACAEPKFWP